MKYSSAIAFSKKEDVEKIQENKLIELINYVANNSPYYKELFADNNIDPADIKSINDLSKIPFTTKDHLQNRNMDFLCVSPDKIIEYSSTSGTLGSPVTIALTENDLKRLEYNEFSSFTCADGNSEEIYQLMLTLDRQFMAGMAYYSGLRKLGAGIIRLGPGVPSLQWDTIFRLKPTAIVAVPSFIYKMILFAQEHKIDIKRTSVKKAICIGENIRNVDFSLNVIGKKITEAWDIKLYSTYASTEMQTAFTECSELKGGHTQPELIIVEVLDENNQQVEPNNIGEVTVTTLGVEGMPLIRYKTGDLCMYFNEVCKCGRTSPRLSSVIGRKKQMIKYKGTTLYPPALFEILNEMEEISDYLAEVYSNDIGTDEVLIYILPKNNSDECNRNIRANLQARLRVSPQIKYINAQELQKLQQPENVRKIVKFIDSRSV
ncbi:MAG: AMP-binding protein [Bacteroidetes bacterium]|nr:AMP-binding protein [Bacteroidota bacterium]